MATMKTLASRVSRLVDGYKIHVMSRLADLRYFYDRQRPGFDGEAQIERPWGQGPNEDFESFTHEAARQVGFVAWPPDHADLEQRKLQMFLECRFEDMSTACALLTLGVYDTYKAVRSSRAPRSNYTPPTITQFQEIADELGTDWVKAREDARDYSDMLKWRQQHPSISWKEAHSASRLHYVLSRHYGRYAADTEILEAVDQGKSAERIYREYVHTFVMQLANMLYAPIRQVRELALDKAIGLSKGRIAAEILHKRFGQHSPGINHLEKVFTLLTEDQVKTLATCRRISVYAAYPAAIVPYLAAGVRITDIFQQQLTAKELNAFFAEKNYEHYVELFTIQVDVTTRVRNLIAGGRADIQAALCRVRSGKLVMQWVARKYDNPAMTKERVVHGPGGQTRVFKYLDLIDEITPECLVNGLNTSPDVAFQEAHQRREQGFEIQMGKDLPLPKCPLGNAPGITQIESTQALIKEGKDLDHCVGGYAIGCLQGVSYIYHVDLGSGRSTAEIGYRDGTWVVFQHRGTKNCEPSAHNVAAVQRFIAKHNPN